MPFNAPGRFDSGYACKKTVDHVLKISSMIGSVDMQRNGAVPDGSCFQLRLSTNNVESRIR
jgi:hypothetical protein